MRLLFRIIAAVLSAYAFVFLSSIFWRIAGLWMIALCCWLISWIVLELITNWGKENSSQRLLTHFRYGPVAILIFFVVTVIAYDEVKILHSKWMIRQYVYSNASPEGSPSLELHTSYRGWCGNGYSASIYALYGDVAAEGFESSDPAVRARSLRASIEVYDWWNGANYGPFPHLIERAFYNDPDPLVRRIAAEYHVGTVSIPKAPNDQ